jgi:hypothetical protein
VFEQKLQQESLHTESIQMSTKIKSQQAPVMSQSDIKAANWARARLWIMERKMWISGAVIVLGMIGTRCRTMIYIE